MISADNFIKLPTSAAFDKKIYDKLKNVRIPIISYLFANHQWHMLHQSEQNTKKHRVGNLHDCRLDFVS